MVRRLKRLGFWGGFRGLGLRGSGGIFGVDGGS